MWFMPEMDTPAGGPEDHVINDQATVLMINTMYPRTAFYRITDIVYKISYN